MKFKLGAAIGFVAGYVTATKASQEAAPGPDGESGGRAGPPAPGASGDGATAESADAGEPAPPSGNWVARARRWAPTIRVVLFAVVGSGIALVVGGRVPAKVGPFDTAVGVRPSLSGVTVVHLAPLGTIELDTHDWPVALDLRVEELGLDQAERIAENPGLIDELAEPRYTGLLTRAPTAVGDVQSIIERFGEYRAQLSDLVGNVVTLYLAGDNLPTFEPTDDTIRVMHVSDVHNNPQAFDLMEQVVDQFGVDAVVDTGDITDWGTQPESRLLSQVGDLDVPYVFVRGNHDSRGTQRAVADQPNAVVLDGEATEVAGLRFWGIGDPRYTPDKDQAASGPSEQERAEAYAPEVAAQLAASQPPRVDVVLVHDERMVADIGGEVPLVLAGHTHKAREARIERADGGSDEETADAVGEDARGDSLLLVEGSTGGAGLRGLQGDEPKPLEASVLYFDPDTHELLAYDH